jgi:protein-S-isoprenylcysteine O-methyltransferase Ste14
MATRLPDLGRRGGGWVVAQGLLLAGIALSALVGVGWPGGWEVVGWVLGGLLFAAGGFLLVAGGLQLGPALTPYPAPLADTELAAHGVYARVRHPIYGGVILLALGWSTLFASVAGLVLTVLLAAFLDLKSRREEQWLTGHDAAYAGYRRRVPRRFLPGLW